MLSGSLLKKRSGRLATLASFLGQERTDFWDSDNCIISFARTLDNKCLIVVRSNQTKRSRFMEKEVVLRYMLGFEISGNPSEPKAEMYIARNNFPDKREGPKNRWVLQLDDKHWIWEWAQEGGDIANSTIYKIYNEIVNEIESSFEEWEIISSMCKLNVEDDRVIPVLYQPSVDALKNFVREVHCARDLPTRMVLMKWRFQFYSITSDFASMASGIQSTRLSDK